MKKVMLPILLVVALQASAQTYKLETVFIDREPTKTFLSHVKYLEGSGSEQETFSLWGYQLYFENKDHGTYEVEYFKGTAKETYQFLAQVVAFSTTYQEEENIVAHIKGIQVKVSTYFGFKRTLVYDRDRKVACQLNQKEWRAMAAGFAEFCERQHIDYK